MSELTISLLGNFEASLNNQPLPAFRTRSVQALLIYLVCEAKQPSSREQIMDLLWPGLPLASAQSNMRQTLYRLRKLIPEVSGIDGGMVPFLSSNRKTIQINPDANYFADVQAFSDLLEHQPEKAIELYRGNFLTDFYLADSETFEAWANSRRELYRQQALAAMEQVTAVSIQNGNYDQAMQLAQRQLEIDNLRESSHQQLMEGLARNGRRQEALAHFGKLQQLLQDELAIEPSQETRLLVEAIRQDNYSSVPSIPSKQIVSVKPEPARPKHNLPQRLTSFIGREKEITAVSTLVTQNRLVMLMGVGGIGKTNLSLQVGQSVIESFPDGVWFIELAPIVAPQFIPQTVAAALGLQESPNQTILESLLAYLQRKHCLLIMDNCEHLIDGVAQFVQTVLQRCPQVTILASSRELLALPAERPFQVPPLTIPKNGQQSILEDWRQYEAVRLFVERAQVVFPEFQITAENAASIVQICQQLDGIPLALELAAARVKRLTTAQIADRLDNRFRLLTKGSRAALPRQQTLHALINWSWELLTETEQLLLQRLSVFTGEMNLEAVEAVCADEEIESFAIFDLLDDLVNKSLVVAKRVQGQETEYLLLETIRQFALEHLAKAGQVEAFRRRHLAYFLQLAETAAPYLQGPDILSWLNQLEDALDNIRVALDWAQENDVEAGLRLIFALTEFCWTRGNIREMEVRLGQLLAQTASVSPLVKANGIWLQGWLNGILHHHELAIDLMEKSLTIYRELEDLIGEGRALTEIGHAWHMRGELEKGHEALREAITLRRSLGDKVGTAWALMSFGEGEMTLGLNEQAGVCFQESVSLFREAENLSRISVVLLRSGILATEQGDFEAALSFINESLSCMELLGVRGFIPHNLQYLGHLYFQLGDYPMAQTTYEKALSISKETESYAFSYEWTLVHLGYAHLRGENLAQAKQIFHKSLEQFQKSHDTIGIIYTLEGFASLAAQQGQGETAVSLFAWANTTRQMEKNARQSLEQASVDRDIKLLQKTMGKDAYAVAYTAGQTMTMAQAIAAALSDLLASKTES